MNEMPNGSLSSPPGDEALHRALRAEAMTETELLDRAHEPTHPDDDRFFDFWEGRLSPEDRLAIAKHVAVCPPCLHLFAGIGELVREVPLAGEERQPEPARKAERHPVLPRSRRSRSWLAVALSTPILLTVGVLAGRFLWPFPPPALFVTLFAFLVPAEGDIHRVGPKAPPLIRSAGSVYHLPQRCWLDLGSPRSGVATVVILTDRDRKIYSQVDPNDADQTDPIYLEAGQNVRYGPIRPPARPAIVFLIVTEQPCLDVVQSVFPAAGTTPDQLEALLQRLQDNLKNAGHTWLAVQRIAVEPQ